MADRQQIIIALNASMDAIRQLNQRLALRANYDFLTQLLSRSGLYESLGLNGSVRRLSYRPDRDSSWVRKS
jgi:GGDEF domain-containing protein